MPIYEFECPICGRRSEEYYRSDDIGKPRCCEKEMKRVYSLAGFTKNFVAGYDIGADQYFDSEKQRQEWMARRGVRHRKT